MVVVPAMALVALVLVVLVLVALVLVVLVVLVVDMVVDKVVLVVNMVVDKAPMLFLASTPHISTSFFFDPFVENGAEKKKRRQTSRFEMYFAPKHLKKKRLTNTE